MLNVCNASESSIWSEAFCCSVWLRSFQRPALASFCRCATEQSGQTCPTVAGCCCGMRRCRCRAACASSATSSLLCGLARPPGTLASSWTQVLPLGGSYQLGAWLVETDAECVRLHRDLRALCQLRRSLWRPPPGSSSSSFCRNLCSEDQTAQALSIAAGRRLQPSRVQHFTDCGVWGCRLQVWWAELRMQQWAVHLPATLQCAPAPFLRPQAALRVCPASGS